MTFAHAFERLNGRPPTTDEVKKALAIADITKQSDLDPVLLLFIADAKANDERAQMVADLRSIATDTVETIRNGLPTDPEWAKAAAWATTLTRATTTQATIMLGALILVGAISLFAGFQLGAAVAGWGNHRVVCADLRTYINGTANYYVHQHEHGAAQKIAAIYWKTCQ